MLASKPGYSATEPGRQTIWINYSKYDMWKGLPGRKYGAPGVSDTHAQHVVEKKLVWFKRTSG